MKHAERITPIAAAAGALATLLCCLPLGFAAAAATASLSLAVETLRPFLLGISFILVAVGFLQVYRGKRQCQVRRSQTSMVIFWVCAAVVLLVTLFPQVVAAAIADLIPAR